jgi:hypothetical protein
VPEPPKVALVAPVVSRVEVGHVPLPPSESSRGVAPPAAPRVPAPAFTAASGAGWLAARVSYCCVRVELRSAADEGRHPR